MTRKTGVIFPNYMFESKSLKVWWIPGSEELPPCLPFPTRPFYFIIFFQCIFFLKKKLIHVSLYSCLWVNCHTYKGYSHHSHNFASLIMVYLLLTAVFCKGLFGKDAGNAPSSQSYYVPKSQEFHLKAIRNLHVAPTCVPCCSVSKRTFVL